MDDPLAFPVLAGAALTQGFGFLYQQLQALLERRRTAKQGRPVPEIEVGNAPAALREPAAKLQVNDQVLAEREGELELLQPLLALYADHRRQLDGQDEALRTMLGRLRVILEHVYGQRLTFQDEPDRGPGLRIIERVDAVHGESVGLISGRLHGPATVEVIHEVKTVHPGATSVGARFDNIG